MDLFVVPIFHSKKDVLFYLHPIKQNVLEIYVLYLLFSLLLTFYEQLLFLCSLAQPLQDRSHMTLPHLHLLEHIVEPLTTPHGISYNLKIKKTKKEK